jgi:hypothetical protein
MLRYEKPDRAKLKSRDLSEVTPQEFGAAALGSFAANFGTWSVNEADKTFIQKYEGALVANNEGTEAKATVSLVGDELKLTYTGATGGRGEFVYRRAK